MISSKYVDAVLNKVDFDKHTQKEDRTVMRAITLLLLFAEVELKIEGDVSTHLAFVLMLTIAASVSNEE